MNRKFFYFFLFVVILLVIAMAFLLRNMHSTAPAPAAVLAPRPTASYAEAEPAVTSDDFVQMLQHPQAAGLPSASDILNRPQAQQNITVPLPNPAGRVTTSPAAFTAPQAAAVSYQNRRPTTAFPPARYTSSQSVPGVRNGGKPSTRYTPGSPSAGVGGYVPSAAPLAGSPVNVGDYQQGNETRQNMLSALTPQQTWQQQKKMNSQLQGFSAGIERAIASAMLPKSKRQQNIEKYLNRSRGEAAQMDTQVYGAETKQAGGAVAQVMRQLAAQSQNIVNDMRNTYGDKAAEGAQSIMNDFQKEMNDTLSAPGDPQEKQIRANAVNNKYNQKLQQYNQNLGLTQLAQQLQQEDEKYLQKLAQAYGPETEAAARAKLDANRAQKMAVYSQYQSEAEATRQLLALDAQRQKDLEEVVRSTAKPGALSNLTQIQNELAKEQILQDAKDEAEGRKAGRAYWETQESLQERKEAWKNEGNEIVKGFSQFGDQYAAEAQNLVNNLNAYRSTLREEALKNGATESEVVKNDMMKTEETNKKLEELKSRALTDTFNQQNDQRLQAVTQNMQGVPEEAKQDWTNKARPIMEKYNQQRAALASKVKNQEEYEQGLKQLDEQEMKELQNIQVKMPQQAQP